MQNIINRLRYLATKTIETKKFFNNYYALDTKNFLLEAFFGVVQTFIIGWLVGASVAAFYNAQIKNK